MKKLIAFMIVLMAFTGASAQMSEALKGKLSSKEYISVKVIFNSDRNIKSERKRWQQYNVPVAEWPKLVNRVLMKQAMESQAEALQLIQSSKSDQVLSFESFYIVNMIILKAKPELIYRLYQLEDVIAIDLANEQAELIKPDNIGTAHKESVASTEPGLIAVNAPPMWSMGYTGKGGIAYDYDTGVWPDHPAYADRFLGNFATLDQSWYGYYNKFPTGATGDHGTHVLGTIAGLNHQTGDTLGVAFGAYWIANDLIGNASIAADLPPLAEMVKGFEWALNPDGDTSTSDDVPDVINNSWRWRDIIDTVQCGGYIVQLMNAIEAAGIANVFSGGNTGPSNNGVNAPQRINTSEVNTFSVGSVNGNVNFPYPISGFSTRGPTQCPGTGSLKIHPEVVAPGQNVRSAWGSDSYNTISGTSMASPHVSGAVLLLKEAFPQLSGDTLLNELYQTAVDLGAPGEDNTYGRGIIDVYAAFQSLSQRYTAVDPTQTAWDLAVEELWIDTIGAVGCDSVIEVWAKVTNLGVNSINNYSLSLEMLGDTLFGTVVNASPPPVLHQGVSVTWKFTKQGNLKLKSGGEHEIRVVATINNLDHDLINNRRHLRFNFRETRDLPFQEDFESGISSRVWYNNNEDAALTWDTIRVPDGGGQKLAAYMNFLNYEPRANQVDQLWTPQLRIPAGMSSTLKFDLAYQEYVSVGQLYDTLKVLVSTDCGASSVEVYKKSGMDLNTTGNTGPGFIPQNRSEWRRDSVDLSAFAGQDVLVIFEGVNRNGNDLFLDNISIYSGATDPMHLGEQDYEHFSIYPVPVTNELHLIGDRTEEDIKFRITDMSGKLMQKGVIEPFADRVLSVAELHSGAYLLEVVIADRIEVLQFIKN